ncbi:MAG: hypothetical protein EOO99_07400 [Pedobacter sp.]|nr:MAG: hypothetical protein EOO99_07400 [Pedobacter sp.]
MYTPMETKSIPNPNKSANQKAIKFVILMLIGYFLLSQGHLFMNSVTNVGGTYHHPWFAENLNYIQWLKTSLIVCSTALIRIFGFHVIYNETQLLIVDGPTLVVGYSCLGLGVWSFLIAFIIAFPAKLNAKLKLFIFGTIMIYVLNVMRIAGLGILLGTFKSQRELFEYHHEIFNIIVYLCIFIVIYFWIKKQTNSKSVAPSQNQPETSVNNNSNPDQITQ